MKFDAARKASDEQRAPDNRTDDVPPITLTWTPVAEPGAGLSSGSDLPITPERITTYSGGSMTALEAQIETLPIIDELEVDDYIYVFPADSGIEPQYVMFQRRAGPRYEPGVATGYGEEVTGIWPGEAARTTGAPIADQLRGRTFRNFGREAVPRTLALACLGWDSLARADHAA